MKKVVVFLLAALMVLSVLSACGNAASSSAPAAGSVAAGSSEPADAPSETVKLTYWSDLGTGKGVGAITSLAENTVWQILQEKFNVEIEFQHPPVETGQEAFNLILASGEYPDLIEYDWKNVAGGTARLIDDGVLIPLNEAIESWAPNLTAFYAENEDIRKEQELNDGTYYLFPSVYGDDTCRYSGGPVIRMDWFEKLDIEEIPTTIDGWTEMLRAVKVTDLNENGEADEVPFFFCNWEDLASIPAIGSAFGVNHKFLFDENGKVMYSPMSDNFKDYLTLLNMWYEEGLIDPESLVAKTPQRNEKYTANKIFAIPGYMGGGITTLTGLMKDNVEGFQMMPVPYPTLVEGDDPIIATREFAFNGTGVAITSACENVEAAVKMLDYGYGEEGNTLMLFGVEGESYTMVDGVPTYTDLILNNPDGLSNLQAMAKYCYWQSSAPCVKYGTVVNQRDRLPEQIEGRKNWMAVKNERLLPQVIPSADESNEMATIMTDVETYAKEMFSQFVSGQTSLDEFDSYVETLKSMGVERAVEITQGQVDNYNNKP